MFFKCAEDLFMCSGFTSPPPAASPPAPGHGPPASRPGRPGWLSGNPPGKRLGPSGLYSVEEGEHIAVAMENWAWWKEETGFGKNRKRITFLLWSAGVNSTAPVSPG